MINGLGGHHGPAKVNIWQDPLNPGNWKEEQVRNAAILENEKQNPF